MYSAVEPSTSGSSGDPEIVTINPYKKEFFVTIEPVLLLVFFASSFTDGVITNVVESRVCEVILGLPHSNCSGVIDAETQSKVQPISTRLLLARALLEATLPALLSFFIGPWSDLNGRKPFLISALGGCCLSYLVWCALSYASYASPYFFITSALSVACTGGYVAIFTCCFCYIGDVTKENNRALRMAFAQSSLMVGILSGYLLIPRVYETAGAYGPQVAFLVGAASTFVSLLYVSFFLPETVDKHKNRQRKSFFNLGNVRDMFMTILMKRPLHGRTVILLLISVCSIAISIMMGEVSVRYMSLQEKYSWTLPQYTRFSAITSFVGACSSLFGMLLFRRVFGFSELVVAFLVTFSAGCSQLLVALSTSSLFFIVAVNIGCLGVLNGPVIRTELSKIVSKEELGKVFAFLSSMEAVIPLLVSPIYTFVYSSVLSSSPMSVYFLSVGLSSLNFLLLMIVAGIHFMFGKPYFTELSNEEDSLEEELPCHSSINTPTVTS